ncbi:hypothetical protein [Nocardioides coralli]|uniref:hypothetical protein n=1 Tax=Nocardioides coralli TaxID=2872154 RepID=UPI001CA38A06|nr:hypothetical protein [Nocardioides coralli]QZY28480.1 hypothetical protein K6T13_13550 [Nocardioides coralli]
MTALRVVAAPALLLVGAVTGVAAVAVHATWWGLPLVLVGLVAALAAVGPGWLTRLPFALGFAAAVGVAVVPRAEGDVAVSADAPGWSLLLVALAVAAVAVVTLPRPGGGDESGRVGPPT